MTGKTGKMRNTCFEMTYISKIRLFLLQSLVTRVGQKPKDYVKVYERFSKTGSIISSSDFLNTSSIALYTDLEISLLELRLNQGTYIAILTCTQGVILVSKTYKLYKKHVSKHVGTIAANTDMMISIHTRMLNNIVTKKILTLQFTFARLLKKTNPKND